jgi:4-hydroxyproline epimerase
MQRIRVIDSHTGGEPTRVVIAGGPDLGHGTMAERRAILRARHDEFRSAVVNEPRGSDVLVGALLCEPTDPACVAGVIFFNNVGYLGMCGHGTIGVAVTLAHLGRIGPGRHRLETPVGTIAFDYREGNSVTLENVPSMRHAANVTLNVDGIGPINGRSFVLCPGKAYDRSPCGTGTSAKLACLFADGRLREGQIWRQESIVGSVFEGSVKLLDGHVIPRITGSAYVHAETTLLFDPHDPFRTGIRL